MRCPCVYRADETGRRIETKSLSSSGEVGCLIPLFFFVSPSGRATTAPRGRATTTGG